MPGLKKNVASQVIYFGFVSAVSGLAFPGVTVAGVTAKDGGAQAAVGGTFVNDGGGQYHYLPTQAETNGTAVGFAFGANVSVVPVNFHFFTDVVDTNGFASVNAADIGGATSVGSAGYAAPDWSQINAPTSTVNLSNTTIGFTNAVNTTIAATISGNVTVGGYAAGQDPASLVLDAPNGLENTITVRQGIRYSSAALAGVLAGAATNTVTVGAINNPGTPRITATVDASGDRTTVNLS